jgi:hypothetical protein
MSFAPFQYSVIFVDPNQVARENGRGFRVADGLWELMCPKLKKTWLLGHAFVFPIYIQNIKLTGSGWTYFRHLYFAWNQGDEGKMAILGA